MYQIQIEPVVTPVIWASRPSTGFHSSDLDKKGFPVTRELIALVTIEDAGHF